MPDAVVTPADVLGLRRRLKYSQAALAKRIGVTQATVCRLERGTLQIKGPVREILAMLIRERAA